MKNKLTDLNNHLFAQLERLGDEDLNEEQLQTELERTKAISSVAKNIVENGRLLLDAQVTVSDSIGSANIPLLLK